ncbi:MAG: heparinase II/III-family protein [Elioraea sp.]|nr:heparinase II/III-family protein [Elioraea sp.]
MLPVVPRGLVLRAVARRGHRAVLRRVQHELRARLAGDRAELVDPVAPLGPFLAPGQLLAQAVTGANGAAGDGPGWPTPPLLPSRPDDDRPYHRVSLYAYGDVRLDWEGGRWGVLPRLGWLARTHRHPGLLVRLEREIATFLRLCPPYRGVMWASAQEAAIRLLHLVVAARFIDAEPTAAGRALAALLVDRILASLGYERSLANNHGLVCAAALAVAGAWLGDAPLRARGTAVLAADVPPLVTAEGGFAQVSTRYHRMALDALAVAALLAGPLPEPVMRAGRAMSLWLARLADAGTGRVPRLGHDDGTVLCDALGAEPDDVRPSLVRAEAAFGGRLIDPVAALAGLGPPSWPTEGGWADLDGGTAGLRLGHTIALLRLPCGRFTPGQGDVMHLSLLHAGEEILRDGGSWLYNPPAGETDLAGTRHHNTAQWGDEDRPPRLSRWLFAPLPRMAPVEVEPGRLCTRDRHHERTVLLRQGLCIVIDRLERPGAVARWRLAPALWRQTGTGAASSLACLTVRADGEVAITLGHGWEAPRYGRRRLIPVLEIRPAPDTRTIITAVRFAGATSGG